MEKELTRPTPAPRRFYPEIRKCQYENVTIDLINKNLNINSENIHAIGKDKIPNNKVFMGGEKKNSSSSQINQEDDTNSATTMTSAITTTTTMTTVTTTKSILTETNNLHASDENENIHNLEKSQSEIATTTTDTTTPTPIPAPRKPQNNEPRNCENDDNYLDTEKIYANETNEMISREDEIESESNNSSSSLSSPINKTGAISKEVNNATVASGRKAPEIPAKTYLFVDHRNYRDRSSRYSISSEVSSSSFGGGSQKLQSSYGSGSFDLTDNHFIKSASNNTLDSSMEESSTSSDNSKNSKYKSPAPGYVPENIIVNSTVNHVHDDNDPNDLFKSLGTTSKLLGESIGERFAIKAKGAKNKLDKNIKTSQDLLNNLGADATSRLKSVGKRINTIGNNFTLTKKDKDKKKSSITGVDYDLERPQTVPPNDQVFQSITFSSPLNRKAGGIYDLSGMSSGEVAGLDCSYEVPRSLKILDDSAVGINDPPSYEDAVKTSTPVPFSRSSSTSKSLIVPKNFSADIPLAKQRSNPNLQAVGEEETPVNSPSIELVEPPSLPMPAFPPPILSKETSQIEGLYGKLNPIQPPARQKRRKNYETVELRRAGKDISCASARATVDSAEIRCRELETAASNSDREDSLVIRDQNREAEAKAPQPDRSDSWEYYEETTGDSDRSSPEPLYANNEATYGKVFEMESSSRDLLAPQLNNLNKPSINRTSASKTALHSKEIINEFDPLHGRKPSTICRSDKSNQLLLLEHLLEEDTYGTLQSDTKSDDDLSVCTSEEDNLNVSISATTEGATAISTSQAPKEITTPTVVLPTPSRLSNSMSMPESNKVQIVHQNAQLLSDSMENILEENATRTHLSRVDEIPQVEDTKSAGPANSSRNQSNWFVGDNENKSQSRVNPFDKLSNLNASEGPPSYFEAIGGDSKPPSSPSDLKTKTSKFINSMNVFTTMKNRVDALKRKTSFRTGQRGSNEVKIALKMIPRPTLSPLLVRYEGPLIRFPSGVVEDILKEMQNRKAVLRDRQFQTFLDQDMKNQKEAIPLEFITTLQCVSNSRVTDNSTHFYCFEITTAMPKNSHSSTALQNLTNPNLIMTSNNSGNCKLQRVCHMYGVSKESERSIWMQKILESLTNVLPTKYTCHYYRAGWCYLKTSITSEWSGTWLVLKKTQRRLLFVTETGMNVEKMDLRKARCIVLKDNDETINNLHVESGPIIMIDCPPFTVYMIMSSARETKTWRHIIREVAHNNGSSLNDQQLTKFNVPVLVDKCINFVYIHGSMSEGIYRKSGSENSILKLMAAFRDDAFNVEITRNEYNEHDVANVLKRFMRDLPERLLGKLSESFICVTEMSSATDKIVAYKELLERLPVIERETLKKIVGHLWFISSQKAKNKMSVQNLTMIWGPTLLRNQALEMVYSQKEADVLTDLVVLNKSLFPLSMDEARKEQDMLLCLQKYYAAAETLSDSVKKSGDLKMWIVINPNPDNTIEEKTQVNVTISPTKTAYEVCKELAPKMNLATHEVSLHEIILNGNLERPLHHDTKVFDTVLSWSYWPEDDRKNNCLVAKPLDILREVQRAVKNLATVTPGKELRFADNKTKSMKSYMVELRDGKIVISKKDKNDKFTIVKEIFLQNATAYLGCEKKRDFPWSWAITFVEKCHMQILRSRESPYIGHVIAGSEWVDRTIWFSSIWYSLYGESILPPAEIII